MKELRVFEKSSFKHGLLNRRRPVKLYRLRLPDELPWTDRPLHAAKGVSLARPSGTYCRRNRGK